MAEEVNKETLERAAVLKSGLWNEEKYEYADGFVPGGTSVSDTHTTPELVGLLEKNEKLEIDARVLSVSEGKARYVKMDRKQFLETWKKNESKSIGIRESDSFSLDTDTGRGLVGNDFVPLLSGPFYKQLYYYDYLRMHAASFHAYHHDPFARRVCHIIRDFTLGRGFRVDCDDPKALALWRAFERVNNLYKFFHNLDSEMSIYGEVMIWWLPNNETKIGYQLKGDQAVPKGMLPRVRLIDPSVIWEIVTYPEDITRVLYYQWVAPTQYQMYTAPGVPSTKFIFQQIPAEQVMHFKLNAVSNEKRGRGVLFPVLGYLKRLRDSVNYSIIALQKASAWSIDTAIEGSVADVDAYVESQRAIGTIPPAGSEFVHTSKVKRDYLSNQAAGRAGGANSAFEWCLSAIAAGTGIPVNYLGTHLSGAQTRASAIVATEPVAKLFEMRQYQMELMIKEMAKRLFRQFDIDENTEIEITFPTIVEQDRTTKMKDLLMAQESGWISKKRAASIAAKELGITEFEYEEEAKEIEEETPEELDPYQGGLLTAQGKAGNNKVGDSSGSKTAITQPEKRQVAANTRT